MAVRRDVVIGMRIKLEGGEILQNLEKISTRTSKGLTRVTKTLQDLEKVGFEWKRTTVATTTVQRTLGRQIQDVTKGLAKYGRRIGFTGFILSFTAQRIVRSFQGIAKTFLGFIKNIGDVDRALLFLSDTLTKLALADILTPEMREEVVEVFSAWFDAARDFEGQVARLQATLAPFGTAILTAVTPYLSQWIDKLREVIEEHPDLIDRVSEAAGAIMEAMTPAVEKLIERLPDIVDLIMKIAPLLGSFVEGLIEGGIWLLDMAAKIAEWLPGAGGIAKVLGRILIPLMAIGVPLSLFGSILSGIGTFFGPVISGGLGFVKFLIQAHQQTGIFTAIAMKVGPALGAMKSGLGMVTTFMSGPLGIAIAAVIAGITLLTLAYKTNFMGFKDGIDKALPLVGKFFGGILNWIEKVVGAIKGVIRWFQKFFGVKQRAGRAEVGVKIQAPSGQGMQRGGVVPETGIYRLHRGEAVIPAQGRPGLGGGLVQRVVIYQTIDIGSISGEVDLDRIREAVDQGTAEGAQKWGLERVE